MLTNKIKSHVPYDDWSAMLEVACKQYIDCSVDIEDPNIAHARWVMWTLRIPTSLMPGGQCGLLFRTAQTFIIIIIQYFYRL